MADPRPCLSLAHSGDPDDVFMWWPATGMVTPDASPVPGERGTPAIDTGRFRFRAVPGDISRFNRLAAGDAPHDITALSVRAWANVADRYAMTSFGGSFGEGYGPKVVARDRTLDVKALRRPGVRIAIPGLQTTAFLTLGLLLGPDLARDTTRFVELPFDAIIPAAVRGDVDAGLVIHEGQIAFAQAGLREVVDLGAWWGETRGMPLPLGVNAVRLDLDQRFGQGSIDEVVRTLRASLDHALANRERSIDASMPFARANARESGTPEPTRAEVARYLGMYVTGLTRDMGDTGRHAIATLLGEGAAAGLCPRVHPITTL